MVPQGTAHGLQIGENAETERKRPGLRSARVSAPWPPSNGRKSPASRDEFRQFLRHVIGHVVVPRPGPPGVAALGRQAVERIVKTIAVFDDFCHANDPHEEHDFGSFEADGQTIFFKIDYFDKSLTYHSPDPSDPAVTERVITIMLPDEY